MNTFIFKFVAYSAYFLILEIQLNRFLTTNIKFKNLNYK